MEQTRKSSDLPSPADQGPTRTTAACRDLATERGNTTTNALVFVFHPMVGVARIPRAYMDSYEASGFRYATESEVVHWYDQHDLPRPSRLAVTTAPRAWYT